MIIVMVKQKGGKVIGQGTYGCVVDPVVPCSKTPSNKKNVSKLMSDKDNSSIKAEVAIGKKLSKIDPDFTYTIYAKDACMIESKNLNLIEDESDKCGHLLDGQLVGNLIMPKGGAQLGDILHNYKLTRKEILKILLHLLYGCRLLLKHGVAHMDLSDRNILMVVDDKNKFRPVMIDFGLYTPSSFVELKTIMSTHSKYIWPIEVYSKMKVHRVGITPVVKEEIDNYNKNVSFKDYGDKIMVYQLGLIFDTIVSPHKTIKGLFRDMRQEMPNKRLNIEECIKRVHSLWPNDKAPNEKSTPQHLKRIITPPQYTKKDKSTPRTPPSTKRTVATPKSKSSDIKSRIKDCIDDAFKK